MGSSNRDRGGVLNVTPEEFVRIWQTSKTGKEVAARSGMTTTNASVRANYLRARGVPLKKFSQNGGYLDVETLKKIAEGTK